MGISIKPENLKRYKDFTKLLLKYGSWDLVKNSGLEGVLSENEPEVAPAGKDADELANDLEKLGPTYIKLGQFLSTRVDILPPEYVRALIRLQDQVEQIPFEAVEETISTELGVRISKAFDHFEKQPLASASLSQVHLAILRNGREVAVKVQRPDIRKEILTDLNAFQDVAQFVEEKTEIGKRFLPNVMLTEFRRALIRELDFSNEANNLKTMQRNLEDFPRLVIPSPVADYSTSRVLTMEFIHGKKVTKLSPLRKIELDGEILADELFRAYLKQILIDGFFHADPHPGNVFITNSDQIALIDLGMVAHLPERIQKKLLQFLVAVSEGHGEDAAKHVLAMSSRTQEYDEKGFFREATDLISSYKDLKIEEIEVGRVVLEVTRVSANNGVRFPTEISLLGKTLLNLDIIGRKLAPEYDPNESIRRNSVDLFQKKMRKDMSLQSLLNTFLDAKDLVVALPERLNKILTNFSENRFEVKVDALDERYLMTGFQKVANRLTLGVILAAMIVGAALIMNIETSFTIFGYPGIAILFFLIAGIGAASLAFKILFYDEPIKRKKE